MPEDKIINRFFKTNFGPKAIRKYADRDKFPIFSVWLLIMTLLGVFKLLILGDFFLL